MKQTGVDKETIFYSPAHGPADFEETIQRIKDFVAKEPGRHYKIIIGTDSESAAKTCLISAVTVWRVGSGGVHFWTKSKERGFPSLRERITAEAMASITLAQEVRSRLQVVLGDDFFWDGNEIHVDVGRNGPTRDLIEGIAGMIRGYNFEPIIKPYAFGASVVADRHT